MQPLAWRQPWTYLRRMVESYNELVEQELTKDKMMKRADQVLGENIGMEKQTDRAVLDN